MAINSLKLPTLTPYSNYLESL